jgi:Helix-turn-helix domain
MTAASPLSRYLRPSTVAKEYGIPAGTLANWRSSGRGPAFVRLSARQIMYSREAIECYFKERLVEPRG